jgi:hypothetical protein
MVCPHISSNDTISNFVELQFAHLVGNKTLFFDVGILIILGEELVTFSNMDVYLEPLIEELQMLWQVVKTFDSF